MVKILRRNAFFAKLLFVLFLMLFYLIILNFSNNSFNNANIIRRAYYNTKIEDDTVAHRFLNLLSDVNAFLADINILKEISIYQNSSHLKLNFGDYLNESTKNKNYHISFGLFNEDSQSLSIQVIKLSRVLYLSIYIKWRLSHKDIARIHSLNCSNETYYTISRDVRLLTKIVLTCDIYKVNLNIFHSRDHFLWIGANNENGQKEWFNDVPRAMQKFV